MPHDLLGSPHDPLGSVAANAVGNIIPTKAERLRIPNYGVSGGVLLLLLEFLGLLVKYLNTRTSSPDLPKK
ncbi:hypothetical protein BS47DRAFT_1345476 [Hydnum rufescens UP504]|uniref:Uncharacterized protein n=1 Tax=Hydnum rufescens UP504 TaxID=1448309 RepID=A0A9P6AUV8_9AGAM|nr:hypothetical protein BS47DRAFT_1345476 [Hydnum rufescens UP504]